MATGKEDAAMKMTMHIDETLLDDVIQMFGCASKTEAVNFALKEVVRKKKLRAFLKKGTGMTSEELKASVETGYDPSALRVAEPPASYGSGRAD